jgi:hypothetical protein
MEVLMTSMGKRAFARIVVSATILLVALQAAIAADVGSGSTGELTDRRLLAGPWTVTVMPYLWLPWLQGDVTVKGRTGSLYVNPYWLLEHLERAPWMSYIEARNGRLILYNDIFYAKVGVNVSGIRTVGNATIVGSASADFSEGVIETGAAYRIARWWSGASGGLKDGYAFDRYTAIDLLAGARYWQQDMNFNLALTGTLDTDGLIVSGSRAFARSGVVDWVDPLVGFRIRQSLAPGQELMFRADIGGFDVGSQFSWNVMAAYNFNITVRNGITYTGMLGFRALSVDYEQGSGRTRYDYDVVQYGPVMGLSIKF